MERADETVDMGERIAQPDELQLFLLLKGRD